MNSWARWPRWEAPSPAFRWGSASRPRATLPAAIAATAAPASATCAETRSGVGVQRPGGFAELVVVPAFNVFRVPKDIPGRGGGLLRPAGERRPHRAGLRLGGRGRPHYRRRPHRRHGGRHLQARGRALRGGDRRQPLPAGAGQEDGCHPGGGRAHHDAAPSDAGAGDDGGLRRGDGDVRTTGRR